MKQHVRYVKSADGVSVAWSELGRGMPLVKAATWMTHLQYDLESPIWLHWIRFLSQNFRYVRYDERGCGMSERSVADVSSTHWVDDLEAVVDAAHIDRPFALLGISQGAATAVQYAVRHPERVSHLILYGGYAVGGNRSEDSARREIYRAVMEVVRLGWGNDNPTFRQLFTSRFVPGGTQAQIDWFNELCRRTTDGQTAGALLAERGNVDIRAALPRVRVPTLVIHATDDHIAPVAQGRYIAGHIPGAEFVALDSRNHVLLEHESAWSRFQSAVLEFTGQSTNARSEENAESLTAREQQLMALLRAGRSNAQIAFELGIAEKTVRNHFSSLFRKLGVRSRVEALVRTQAIDK